MADVGRPTIYSEEILAKSAEYLASCEDKEIERGTDERPVYGIKVKLPTEGLARHIGVNRDTLYENFRKSLNYWCGRPDLNRHGKLLPRDFKSLASTISPRPRERAGIAHPRRRTSTARPKSRVCPIARHGRTCSGHPRLCWPASKTWMPAT
jgi:hypothetical protein